METQGSLCSKSPYHLLFLIIQSKGEKAVFWMGKKSKFGVRKSEILMTVIDKVVWKYHLLSTWGAWHPGDILSYLVRKCQQLVPLKLRLGADSSGESCGGGRVECPTISPDSWTRKFRVNFLPWPFWAILFISPQNACKGTFKPSQNFFSRKNHNRTVSFLWSTVRTVSLANTLKTWHFPREVWTEMRFLSFYAASMFFGEK